MGDPRVQERDNPLVRRLNAVAEENARLGTALGGGARPPRAPLGPVQGGTATVLPPAAVPLTPEEALGDSLPPAEAEELERRWATDPSNPANRGGAPPQPAVDPPLGMVTDPQFRPVPVILTRPNYVTLIDSLPITEERKQIIRAWVFEGAAQQIMTETARRLDEMQIAFGLAPKEEKGERGEQAKVETSEPAARKGGRRKKGTAVARRRKGAAVQGEPTA